MVAPVFRYLRRLTARQAAMDSPAGPAIGRHQQLLIDSGRAIMLVGSIILTQNLGGASAAASGNAQHLGLGLVLWMLGAALVMLSLVDRQFPRLVASGASIATALLLSAFEP